MTIFNQVQHRFQVLMHHCYLLLNCWAIDVEECQLSNNCKHCTICPNNKPYYLYHHLRRGLSLLR